MIMRSEVSLNFANHSWTQQLRRGVLQGSAFSAEIFARTLDFYVAPLLLLWASTEATWIRGVTGQPLFAIIFADDHTTTGHKQRSTSQNAQQPPGHLGGHRPPLGQKQVPIHTFPRPPEDASSAEPL